MGRGRLAASHGIQQAISTPAPPKTVADLPPIYHKLDWAGHQALMTAMGQDGSEGQDYVNTSLKAGGSFAGSKSVFAAMLGYNVIQSGDYYTLLNRKAVTVSKTHRVYGKINDGQRRTDTW